MIVNNNQIGDYPVSMDAGNENFIDLVESLWRPENPKGINRYSMCWVVCSYICHYLFIANSDDTTKGSMAQTLCEALIYGWAIPETPRFVGGYGAENYLGITHGEKYIDNTYAGILTPSISFSEIEKGFNPTVWQELKPFLISLSEVTDIEYVG